MYSWLNMFQNTITDTHNKDYVKRGKIFGGKNDIQPDEWCFYFKNQLHHISWMTIVSCAIVHPSSFKATI